MSVFMALLSVASETRPSGHGARARHGVVVLARFMIVPPVSSAIWIREPSTQRIPTIETVVVRARTAHRPDFRRRRTRLPAQRNPSRTQHMSEAPILGATLASTMPRAPTPSTSSAAPTSTASGQEMTSADQPHTQIRAIRHGQFRNDLALRDCCESDRRTKLRRSQGGSRAASRPGATCSISPAGRTWSERLLSDQLRHCGGGRSMEANDVPGPQCCPKTARRIAG